MTDKRLEKAKEQVKQTLDMNIQDRRRFVELIIEISAQYKSIQIQEEHIASMKVQLETGNVRQRDKFGHIIDKQDLGRFIAIFEMDLIRMKWRLDQLKEDFYYKTNSANPQDLNKTIAEHYAMIRAEYDKNKNLFNN